MTPIRRVWVTRAEPGASRTGDRLKALGFQPVVAPLLAIRALPQGEPDLIGISALAFTSRNGVEAFAALTRERALPVFAVGDATAEAARAEGFADVRSAAGALADLAALLVERGPRRGGLLVPGAREPAGDLPAMLDGRIEARAWAVYEAVETSAAAPEAFDAVLVHSTRAGRALAARGPFSGQPAIALSAAAAEPLGLGSGLEIRVAPTSDEAALLQTLGKPTPPV